MDMNFPNGHIEWAETHHVIVTELNSFLDGREYPLPHVLQKVLDEEGTGGVMQLGIDLTNKFEEQYKGVEWDGDWLDTIEKFLKTNL
jgi:hypothetical protein